MIRRSLGGPVPVIATGVGLATFALSFWLPFLPLYLIELGAKDNADALAWASLAYGGLGVSRLIVAPIWGALSDRFGRKVMFVRALAFASATTIIAGLATEPWHIAIAFTSQGALSGFVPAATALTSVSSEDSKLGQSIGLVNAAQYLGSTLGPVVGAILALALSLRGAIIVGGLLPALAALLVIVLVPADRVAARRPAPDTVRPALLRRRPDWASLARLTTMPVRIGILLTFLGFAVTAATRLAAPLVVTSMTADADVEGVVGLVFAFGGVASVVGIVVAGRRLARPGVLVAGLVVASLGTAIAFGLLAGSGSILAFMATYALASLAQAALLPGTNTIIATAVPRDQRGTVFGLAATAQAFAFMIGPLAATYFATISFQLGFAAIGLVYLVVAGLVRWKLREPKLAAAESAVPVEPALPVD